MRRYCRRQIGASHSVKLTKNSHLYSSVSFKRVLGLIWNKMLVLIDHKSSSHVERVLHAVVMYKICHSKYHVLLKINAQFSPLVTNMSKALLK